MIDVSIIIPHFESYESLEKLLASIPSAEWIEVLIIDDKSKDVAAWERVKNSYRSTQRIFLENTREIKSAGTCRNIGIENAKGRWLLFSDADDFFLENSLRVLQTAVMSDYDVVYFMPTSIDLETGRMSDRHTFFERHLLELLHYRDIYSEHALRYRWSAPFSKLIRAALISDHCIRFQELPVQNDFMFSMKVGHHMGKFDISLDEIYCVVRHDGSLITKYRSLEFAIARAIDRIGFLYRIQSVEFLPQFYMFLLRFCRLYGIRSAWHYFFAFHQTHIPIRPPSLAMLIRKFARDRYYPQLLKSRLTEQGV